MKESEDNNSYENEFRLFLERVRDQLVKELFSPKVIDERTSINNQGDLVSHQTILMLNKFQIENNSSISPMIGEKITTKTQSMFLLSN